MTSNSDTHEIICSSARRSLCRNSQFSIYKLLGHNLSLQTQRIDTWPTTTDVWCWHCCHPFNTVPLSIPKHRVKQYHHTVTRRYEVFGVFCSLNCAIAYLNERPSFEVQQMLMMLQKVAIDVFCMDTKDVIGAQAAPSKAFLKPFGGELSIEEFRAISVAATCVTQEPPFISLPMVLQTNSLQMSHQIRGLQRPSPQHSKHELVEQDEVETLSQNGGSDCNTTTDQETTCLYTKYMEQRKVNEVVGGSTFGSKSVDPTTSSTKSKRHSQNASSASRKKRGLRAAANDSVAHHKNKCKTDVSSSAFNKTTFTPAATYTVTPLLKLSNFGKLQQLQEGEHIGDAAHAEPSQIQVNWGKRGRRARTPTVNIVTTNGRAAGTSSLRQYIK